MKTLIINDCHLGTSRSSGTTPASSAALRQYLFDEYNALLTRHLDKHLFINGDLFDHFSEDEATLDQTLGMLVTWLNKTKDGQKLTLSCGNHDASAKGDKLSSFHLLTNILKLFYPDRVTVVDIGQLYTLQHRVAVLAHCHNQDLFEMGLNNILDNIRAGNVNTLFLHANVLSPFSEQHDHSLAVTEDMARRFVNAGIRLVFAHDHHNRCINLNAIGTKTTSQFDTNSHIIVLGNQFPASIADCLSHGKAQANGRKFAHIMDEEGRISQVETWNSNAFIDVDWQELDKVNGEMFVRVSGEAAQSQAGEVVSVIAKFRSQSDAYVVSNNVQIEGIGSIEDIDGISLEQIKAFDVRAALLEMFEPDERKVLEKVLEN